MLDTETKTRIDSARDILVGKVPDPKSQVEQITIALIYKFMDDMDRQSEELGGKASFFSDGFRQYAWSNLMDKRIGGVERLNLYAEAIQKMTENPRLPQLFRDIFKGAFLPYRDPETLNLFLKEINGFTYDHSERLGDAYEYLLSVLSSQGQAGQFRTPRHIIDFIVRIVNPKKNETILDPACGTAGFLISAYKHILADNSKDRPGDLLSADERGRLMDNFCGYDISPDMGRLSRANMYLHGFPQPRIHEYDALTSEERWDERYDVIMANPPFMSPKGGIRPHNRFSIKAKRSEVLFVDYIAEHLNVNGRAGVIVPEGIIFQSQNAYKALRKMLLENYLWCVVSLPPGVFNPYSGVKTSILFMDKSLANRTNEILFVKIENDGFDLGAQRRPVEKNDLPVAEKIIKAFQKGCHPSLSGIVPSSLEFKEGFPTSGNDTKKLYLHVSRKRIIETADFNLSGDRYKDNGFRADTKWPMVRLGDVCNLIGGGTPSKGVGSYWTNGSIKWISAKHINEQNGLIGWDLITEKAVRDSTTNIVPKGALVVVTRVSVGKITLLREPVAINQDLTGLVVKDPRVLEYKFLYWAVKHLTGLIADSAQGLGVKGVTRQFMADISIPLPPLDIQRQIVAELDGYRKIIEGAKQIIANYKPTIKIDPKWKIMKIGEVCNLQTGGTPNSQHPEYYGGDIKWLVSGDIHMGEIYDCKNRITKAGMNNSNAKKLPADSVLIALNGQGKTRGTVALLRAEATCNQSLVAMISKDKSKLISTFLYYHLKSRYDELRNLTGANERSGLNMSLIREFKIPIPDIQAQNQIVLKIEEEQMLVAINKKLIKIFEKKIQDKLAEIWGENS